MGPCLSVEAQERACTPRLSSEILLRYEMLDLSLLRAASAGDLAGARAALEAGALTSARTANGKPALSMAAQNGRLEMVRFLLAKGADVNARDWSGRTPLSHAAQHCRTDVVKALLAAGAKATMKADSERGGLLPLHYAAARGAAGVVKALLEHPKTFVDVRDGDYNTPLDHATSNGHAKAAEILLDAGASLLSHAVTRTHSQRGLAVHRLAVA